MLSEVSIEPQYDGVVMVSPDLVYFNDAQPRPDGKKVYHVFEKNEQEQIVPEPNPKEFDLKQEELISKATVQSLYDIQHVSSSY